MAVQAWHWGKLLIIWSWGLLVAVGIVAFVLSLPEEEYRMGLWLLLLALAIPVGLTVPTWRWLSGKDK